MIGQGEFCPAQLGATTMALRWIIDAFGLDGSGPGDVVPPQRPVLGHEPPARAHGREGGLRRRTSASESSPASGTWRRSADWRPGGFPGDAQEVFHEGLRIPPVKIVKAGVEDEDLWRLVLANGRTPRVTAGDLRAMIGSLNVGERRLLELVRRHGVERFRQIKDEIKAYSERRMRAAIGEIPNGTYVADEYIIDNDGWLDEPARVRVAMTVEDDRIVADFTGQRPAATGVVQPHARRDRLGGLQRRPPHDGPGHPGERRALSADRGDRAAGHDRERDVPRRHRRRQLGGASASRDADLEGDGGRGAGPRRRRRLGDRDARDLWRRATRRPASCSAT